MEDNDHNEYNSIGAPPEDVKRKLRYLAEIGNEAVTSAFRISSGYNASIGQEKQDAADAQFHALAEMAMASQERIAQFHAELDELDARRQALIGRIDEKLDRARAKRQQLYDEAIEVEFPDGTVRKVFRDHDRVRDEHGNLVSPDIVTADEASNHPYQWPESEASDDAVKSLEAVRETADTELGEKLQDARARADAGTYSARDLDEKIAEFDEQLAKAEQRLETGLPEAASEQHLTRSGLQTDIVPTKEFGRVSSGQMPELTFDEDFTLPNPGASMPAPG